MQSAAGEPRDAVPPHQRFAKETAMKKILMGLVAAATLVGFAAPSFAEEAAGEKKEEKKAKKGKKEKKADEGAKAEEKK